MNVGQFYEQFYTEIYGHNMGKEKLEIVDDKGRQYVVIKVSMGMKEGMIIRLKEI